MELFSDILDVLNTTLSESVKKKQTISPDEEVDMSYIKKMNLVRLKIAYKESAKSVMEYLTEDYVLEQDEFKNCVKTYKYMLRNPRTDEPFKQNILKSLAILFYVYFRDDGLWMEKYNKCVTGLLNVKNEHLDESKLHSSLVDDSILKAIAEIVTVKKTLGSSIKCVEKLLKL
jgi:hypothetical protein